MENLNMQLFNFRNSEYLSLSTRQPTTDQPAIRSTNQAYSARRLTTGFARAALIA